MAGRTGSGKSYLIKKIIVKFSKVVFYDYKHEHNDIAKKYEVTEDLSEVANFLRDESKKRKLIMYRPIDATNNQFNNLCKICYMAGNCTLVIDEVARHSTSYEVLEYHDLIMRLGRTRNVGIWNITQRPNVIHNTLISEAEHMIFFQLQLKSDRKKIEGVIGDVAEGLRDLEQYHFLYYDHLNGHKMMKPV